MERLEVCLGWLKKEILSNQVLGKETIDLIKGNILSSAVIHGSAVCCAAPTNSTLIFCDKFVCPISVGVFGLASFLVACVEFIYTCVGIGE